MTFHRAKCNLSSSTAPNVALSFVDHLGGCQSKSTGADAIDTIQILMGILIIGYLTFHIDPAAFLQIPVADCLSLAGPLVIAINLYDYNRELSFQGRPGTQSALTCHLKPSIGLSRVGDFICHRRSSRRRGLYWSDPDVLFDTTWNHAN